MPQTNDAITQPAYDRTAARGTQFTPVYRAIGGFFATNIKRVSLPVKFDAQGVIDFTSTPDTKAGDDPTAWVPAASTYITYTRAELRGHMNAVVAMCFNHAPSGAFTSKVPNRSSYTYADLVAILSHDYTVSKGKNEGQVRNLLAHTGAAARSAISRIIKAGVVELAVVQGTAWMAEGVVDTDGNPRPYTSENKARKAHARMAHADLVKATKDGPAKNRVTGEWHSDDTRKAAYIKNAVVAKFDPAGLASPVSIYAMSHIQVRQLAKKAGAPADVSTGAGATQRCIAWFEADLARLDLANA
jgi:hypothetical protein